MAPHRPVDRDNGMRRISSSTRWFAGLGVALVAVFSGFFAAKASNSSSSTPTVNTPVATAPPVTDNGSGSGSTSAQPSQTTPTSPPVTYAPRPHTRSGGS
jgi:hypothetical protein